jgi:flagellar biosynthesis component FlhA
MNDIFIALIIGIVAGIIDVIPMLIMKLNKYASLSAFTHWVILGLIIPFVSWEIAPWLKGLIIGELMAVPVILIVAQNDKKSIPSILLMSALLGAGVAIAGARFIVL